ncbi:MAG: hypothetical protein IT375_34865 [Polyangiaceae bacterium]|nr:hypothetical protein [Polyangiaceae bacterium]
MVADALRELLEAAAEAGARRALAAVAEQTPGALIPIREAGISRRALLAAGKAGELTLHRRGKSTFVERAALERWITSGARAAKPADAIGELIEMTERRRRKTA